MNNIDLLFPVILPAEIWKQIRKVDDQESFGDTWEHLIKEDADRKAGEKPPSNMAALKARIIQKLKVIVPEKRIAWDKLTACVQ